jgi:hypothetical protein
MSSSDNQSHTGKEEETCELKKICNILQHKFTVIHCNTLPRLQCIHYLLQHKVWTSNNWASIWFLNSFNWADIICIVRADIICPNFFQKLRYCWENIWRKVVHINNLNKVSSNLFQIFVSSLAENDDAGTKWEYTGDIISVLSQRNIVNGRKKIMINCNWFFSPIFGMREIR